MTDHFSHGYALIIGVDQNNVPDWALPAVARDVEALRDVLIHSQRCAYAEAHVKLICQLVEGAPLAIELAASWARTLTCAEIAAEIQHNLDFLTTNLRNLAERHRNMQAVFAQSWSLLSTVEQAILCRLSIFRGGFRRQAAEQVIDRQRVSTVGAHCEG